MQILGQLMRHVRLVAGMAKSTEIDLVGAVNAGDLTQKDWADMVQTCRKCSWAGDCPEWLAAHQNEDCAPDTCLNQARFGALKSAARNNNAPERAKQVTQHDG